MRGALRTGRKRPPPPSPVRITRADGRTTTQKQTRQQVKQVVDRGEAKKARQGRKAVIRSWEDTSNPSSRTAP